MPFLIQLVVSHTFISNSVTVLSDWVIAARCIVSKNVTHLEQFVSYVGLLRIV